MVMQTEPMTTAVRIEIGFDLLVFRLGFLHDK